ncbi:hypothetical protein F5Y15DRAFT_96748 [Xylariaceae sp. FL0016]|nr:hypothetical protein F5Y15DRAFT_96748 [Xylariaceae sp. FL0016]
MAALVVAFPKGSNVDLDYLNKKHSTEDAPEALKKAGLVGWRMAKTVPNLPGIDAPYEAVQFVEFKSLEGLVNMLKTDGPAVVKGMQDDLKNYSQLPPVSWIVEHAGGSNQ